MAKEDKKGWRASTTIAQTYSESILILDLIEWWKVVSRYSIRIMDRDGGGRIFIIYSIFIKRRREAKRGGLHVFARHTPATLMIANGCDIRIVQQVLRHRDIRTTLRYAHVSDKTKREMYERYLILQGQRPIDLLKISNPHACQR